MRIARNNIVSVTTQRTCKHLIIICVSDHSLFDDFYLNRFCDCCIIFNNLSAGYAKRGQTLTKFGTLDDIFKFIEKCLAYKRFDTSGSGSLKHKMRSAAPQSA